MYNFSQLEILFTYLPYIAAFFSLYVAFCYLKAARMIEDTPTSKIRSAAQGLVEISGYSKNFLPLTAGLTGEPCVWYSQMVEKLTVTRTQDRTSHQWDIINQQSSLDAFILEDNTGICFVFPKDAKILTLNKVIWRGHTPTPMGQRSSFWIYWLFESWGRYRYTERKIISNTPIFARGEFKTLSLEDLLIESSPALKDYLSKHSFTSVHILTKNNLSRESALIISAIPETHLIRKKKLTAVLFFIAFLFFISLTLHSTYPYLKKVLNIPYNTHPPNKPDYKYK